MDQRGLFRNLAEWPIQAFNAILLNIDSRSEPMDQRGLFRNLAAWPNDSDMVRSAADPLPRPTYVIAEAMGVLIAPLAVPARGVKGGTAPLPPPRRRLCRGVGSGRKEGDAPPSSPSRRHAAVYAVLLGSAGIIAHSAFGNSAVIFVLAVIAGLGVPWLASCRQGIPCQIQGSAWARFVPPTHTRPRVGPG